MSALFYQNAVPQENQSIKCNDITVRGSVVANESVAVAKGISLNGALSFEDNTDPAVSGQIYFPAMTLYTQATSQTTSVVLGGGPQQFMLDCFATASIPAGTAIHFNIFNTSVITSKTIVLCSAMGSASALTDVNNFVSISGSGVIVLTRHNFGTTAATGLQRLCFKLIQTA